MASTIAGLNCNTCFPCGYWKEHVYVTSPRTTKDLVARLQADEAMADANMLRHI
jgi:hypothetical protein